MTEKSERLRRPLPHHTRRRQGRLERRRVIQDSCRTCPYPPQTLELLPVSQTDVPWVSRSRVARSWSCYGLARGVLGKRLDLSGDGLYLSRHPAHPAPAPVAAILALWFSFLAGHGNLRVCASARLLPWRATSITGSSAKAWGSLKSRNSAQVAKYFERFSCHLVATIEYRLQNHAPRERRAAAAGTWGTPAAAHGLG
jgi:hypothetical protein